VTAGKYATGDGPTTAFVFPGQGSQHPVMGQAFLESWPGVGERLDRYASAAGVDLRELCLEASADRLRRPENAQVATLAVGLAVFETVQERFGVSADLLAGHSLGHFSALGAAGMASGADLVTLVRERGRLMARAEDRDGPGRMAAVLGVDAQLVATTCVDRDDVSIALRNTPTQTVISGTVDGVDAALDDLDRGRICDLDVDAAFHSPVMASVESPLADRLDSLSLTPAETPIVSDVSGRVYTEQAVAREDLTGQVTGSINLVGVVEAMNERGVERYVEFPPAGVLTGLIERLDEGAECVTLESPTDARRVFGRSH
jgi:[acyl-carrier-protein] S-malonyltransferase